jgi:hypothetical protein
LFCLAGVVVGDHDVPFIGGDPREDIMKRRKFLAAIGAGTAAAAAATIAKPAIAQSMPELKWRVTASWPK